MNAIANTDSAALWLQATTAATLGAERAGAAWPVAEGAIGTLLSRLPDDSPEGRLVAAAAVLSVHATAGQMPQSLEDALDPAPADDRPACSLLSGRHLRRIMFDGFDGLLPPWCAAADRSGVRAPDELLPQLLSVGLGREKNARWPVIAPVVGVRGRWLAGLNPEWRAPAADAEGLPGAWETGTRAEREAALRALRRKDPVVARQLLESTWAEESTEDRAAFVAVLLDGLDMADEPFLEAALDDSRKEVRSAAADLLARLPASRLVQRMKARLEPVLDIQRARKAKIGRRTAQFVVETPQKLDKSATRDAVESRSRSRMGKGAAAIAQMLSAVPLDHWCERWDLSPDQLVSAAISSDWTAPLIQGWILAAQRQGNPSWNIALLAPILGGRIKADDLGECDYAALACALPAESIEALIIPALRKPGVPLHESIVLPLLDGCEGPWSAELSRAFLHALRKHMDTEYIVHHNRLRALTCTTFAARIDPALADEVATGWPLESQHWTRVNDEIVDVLAETTRLHRDMLEEFEK